MIQYTECRMEGGWLMVKPERESLGAAYKMVNATKGKMVLEYKKFRQKRSLDANAYAWKLMNDLATEIGIPVAEVYRNQIRGISGVSEIVPIKEIAVDTFQAAWSNRGVGWMVDDLGPSRIPGYRNLMIWYGSSVYDSRQFSQLLENIVQDCRAVGVETLPPDRLELLKEQYHEKRHQDPAVPPGC